MIVLLWLLGVFSYLALGVYAGTLAARYAYESDRRRYPSLARGNIREGLGEAGFAFVLAMFFWPFVMLFLYGARIVSWFMLSVVLPQIGEHDREQERQRREHHIREIERELDL